MESILSHLKDSTEKLSDREVVTKRIRSFSELRDSLKSLSQLRLQAILPFPQVSWGFQAILGFRSTCIALVRISEML